MATKSRASLPLAVGGMGTSWGAWLGMTLPTPNELMVGAPGVQLANTVGYAVTGGFVGLVLGLLASAFSKEGHRYLLILSVVLGFIPLALWYNHISHEALDKKVSQEQLVRILNEAEDAKVAFRDFERVTGWTPAASNHNERIYLVAESPAVIRDHILETTAATAKFSGKSYLLEWTLLQHQFSLEIPPTENDKVAVRVRFIK